MRKPILYTKLNLDLEKKHSCNTALIRLIDAWLKDVDSGKLVGAIFLDLRKAFDLVDHEILLHKLKLYHFSEISLNLFESYLENSNQIVKIGNLNRKKTHGNIWGTPGLDTGTLAIYSIHK